MDISLCRRAVARSVVGVVACAALAAPSGAAAAGPLPVVGVDYSCVADAGNPAPGTPAWYQRDTQNQYCAGLRIRDQLLSPAYGFGNVTQGAALYAQQTSDQVGDPKHPRGGITTLVPGSRSSDVYRTLDRWQKAGLGWVTPVSFKGADGATLRGHVFMPAHMRSDERLPGVVITDGSVQAYENLYYWAAEDLVAHGYIAMTYDVQGQGGSDLFPANCPDPAHAAIQCQGVPYQQNYNFYQGAEDSLSYFLSSANLASGNLDRGDVGIAGHSLGAAAVSVVGQCDRRVRAVVAWDNLSAITQADCDGLTMDPANRSSALIHAPALALSNDYLFNTQPQASPPAEDSKLAGVKQAQAAGQDSALYVFRGATHLTYTYIPLVFQASELAERMASYYTVAWFDRYLRDDESAYTRLTASAFDTSADTDSIGTGYYDANQAVPGEPYSGNVPYTINGISVPNALSFYYQSQWYLTPPGGGPRNVCVDVRAHCPAVEPTTP